MKNALYYLVLFLLLPLLQVSAQQSALSSEEQGYLKKGYRVDKNGWIFLHLEGGPYEIGFQRGYLTAKEIYDFCQAEKILIKYTTSQDYDFFVNKAAELFRDKISGEYIEEMQGMVAGAVRAGHAITYDEILFLNGFIDLKWYWWPSVKDEVIKKDGGPGCSAFIATGKQTRDGKIVMAHNSWCGYPEARFFNVIVDLVPEKGHRILMQSWGPLIYSGSDFFITGAGLIGTETTISGFKGYDTSGTPIFERARKAMQYANGIDEWANILIEKNSGAYANSWLLGDINTNEIARLELGLKFHSLEKTADGYYAGSNVTSNPQILHGESDGIFDDIRDNIVARRVRWNRLMSEYEGLIDVALAKQMLADHYDTYLEVDRPGNRTICGHVELNDGKVPSISLPYYPAGAFDGKVVTSEMAKSWQIWAKWGHPCDSSFRADEFLEKHQQYDWMAPVLKDISSGQWTIFPLRKEE